MLNHAEILDCLHGRFWAATRLKLLLRKKELLDQNQSPV